MDGDRGTTLAAEPADVSIGPAQAPFLLFLSHSSPEPASVDRLVAIATEVEAKAGDLTPVRVLFDKEQIQGGDDWRRRLGLMLQICDGAAVLFDEPALESSWVRFEALTLSMRKMLVPEFPLVPLSLLPKGGGLRSRLAQGEWRHLALDTIQHVHGHSEKETAKKLVEALCARGELRPTRSPAERLADRMSPAMEEAGRLAVRDLIVALGASAPYLQGDQRACAALALVQRVLHQGNLYATRQHMDEHLGPLFAQRRARDVLESLAPLLVPPHTVAPLRRKRNDQGHVHTWVRCDDAWPVVRLLISRAFLAENPPVSFAIGNDHGTFDELQENLRTEFRARFVTPEQKLDDAGIDRRLASKRRFVLIPGPVEANVLSRLDVTYPGVAFVVCEAADTHLASLPPLLHPLTPSFSPVEEQNLLDDYYQALEGL